MSTDVTRRGTVALSLTDKAPYDFIVSMGDNTNEDRVGRLPNRAYTLRASRTSFARYRLARQQDVERLLQQMGAAWVQSTAL